MAKKTFENDDNLPALPLPSLKNTLDLYLQSLAPFLTSDELEKKRKIVQEFGDNEGQILHEKLLQRSSEKKNWVNSSLTNRAKRVQNVSFLHGKRIPPRIFFSPQAEVFPRASLPPRGSSLRTSEARAVIETQGG